MISRLTYPLRLVRAILHKAIPNTCYIMWEKRLFLGLIPIGPHKFKVGISTDPGKRRRDVERELQWGVRLVIWMPLPFARRFEQGVLHATRFASTEMPDHPGKTEWRQWYNVISGTLAAFTAYAFGGEPATVFCIISICSLPLDALLIYLLLAAFWYACAVVVAGGVLWGIISML